MTALEKTLSQPGGLSIVLQGPIDLATVAQVARNCACWRRDFPAAQIVCAISTSDCLVAVPQNGGRADRLTPIAGLASHAELSSALDMIVDACDILVFARSEEALPPLKTDSPGLNNTNRMISAALAGMRWASGQYLLRTRNDLLLQDRAFLDVYAAGVVAPRGEWTLFKQRVMLAEVFTLNPLTHSRMPFHFSDWFHFGLTDDIWSIWSAVSPLTYEDSTYYGMVPHLPASRVVERRFHSRLAPEQMVSFPVFKRHFPQLALDCHNDLTSLEESLLILADNFIVANLAECHARIDKYQHIVERMSSYTRLECMSQALVSTRSFDREVPADALYAPLVEQTAMFNSWLGWSRRLLRRLFLSTLRHVPRPRM